MFVLIDSRFVDVMDDDTRVYLNESHNNEGLQNIKYNLTHCMVIKMKTLTKIQFKIVFTYSLKG